MDPKEHLEVHKAPQAPMEVKVHRGSLVRQAAKGLRVHKALMVRSEIRVPQEVKAQQASRVL